MATTLESLQFQARSRADMLDDQFVSDEELVFYINSSIRELYDMLVSTVADYYMKDGYQFTLTDGDEGKDLPEDFYKLRGFERSIDASGDQSSWFTVTQFNFHERNKYNTITTGLGSAIPWVTYRVMASTDSAQRLMLRPQQNTAGVYQLWYVPKCPELVDDDDSFDGINGWEEYVVVDAAIKMLQKQEDDVSVLFAQKKALADRIQAMSADRSQADPEKITDVRGGSGNPYNNNGGFGAL